MAGNLDDNAASGDATIHSRDNAKVHKLPTGMPAPIHTASTSEPATPPMHRRAAGSTAGLPDQKTASGTGHLTQSRPQDRAIFIASRWPAQESPAEEGTPAGPELGYRSGIGPL